MTLGRITLGRITLGRMTLGRIFLNVSAAGLSLPKYRPRVPTFVFVHFILQGVSVWFFQAPPHKPLGFS